MEQVRSLRVLEEQQEGMEKLLQQHRRSLAQHRAALIQLFEGHAAVEAELRVARTSTSYSYTRAVTDHMPHQRTLNSHAASSRSSPDPRPQQHRTLNSYASSSPDLTSDDDDYSSDGRPVGAMRTVMTGLYRMQTRWLEENHRRPGIPVRSRLQRRALDIVYSNAFEVCVFLAVIANCFIMGIEVNLMLQQALKGHRVDIEYVREQNLDTVPPWMLRLERLRVADSAILVLFVVECALRLVAEQEWFFLGPNRAWNILDAVVTIICVTVSVKDYLSSSIDPMDRLRFVRVLRVLRTSQMIRIFRPFRKLRVMLYSILACTQSLAWAAFLLYIFVAVAALYLQDVALYNVQVHNIKRKLGDDDSWDKIQEQLEEYWGTVFKAQMSLLLSVTGGADWGERAEPFCQINKFHCVVYCGWVMLVLFGLINITVGIFARQAQEFHQYDRHLIVEGAMADHSAMRETLMDLFDRMDESDNGFLSRSEIEQGLENLQIRAYFAQLNIDIEMNPDEFFRLLDEDGNDRVDRDEFAKTCMRLQGGAKPLEVARIIGNVEEMKAQLKELQAQIGRVHGSSAA